MSGAEQADQIEEDVMAWLPEMQADDLEALVTVLDLQCPPGSSGKKNTLYKFVLKYLLDLDKSEDKGLSKFLQIHTHLNLSETKPDVTSKPVNVVPEPVKKVSQTSVDILRLKDFKIAGTIGGPGEKDKLSYSSLSYQMLNGKKLGYSDEIICAAVIRAISPGNNLRTYLEGKTNLSKESLLEILRSHYKEKDSASTFTELSNVAQQTNETCLDFVIRLMCLRDKVSLLSTEEGFFFSLSIFLLGISIKYKIGGGVVLVKMNHIPLTFLEYNNIYILMKLKEIKQDIHTESKRKC